MVTHYIQNVIEQMPTLPPSVYIVGIIGATIFFSLLIWKGGVLKFRQGDKEIDIEGAKKGAPIDSNTTDKKE